MQEESSLRTKYRQSYKEAIFMPNKVAYQLLSDVAKTIERMWFEYRDEGRAGSPTGSEKD